MALVTLRSEFRAQEEETCHYFHLFPFYLQWSNGARWATVLNFLIFSFKLALPVSAFTLIKRLLSSFLLSAIGVVSSTYLRMLIFLLSILIPACNPSSLAFLKTCSVYRLNKQGDSRQPCHTLFSILIQSVVPYRVLLLLDLHTGFSEDRCFHLFKSFPQFVMVHTIKALV